MEAALGDRVDRRRERRCRVVDEHGIVSARVRGGREVSIVDISAAGVLIETTHRLLPGSSVELQLTTSDGAIAVRGRVLRSAVSRVVASIVWYRGAMHLERHLSWLGEYPRATGYPVPVAERPLPKGGWGVSSPANAGS